MSVIKNSAMRFSLTAISIAIAIVLLAIVFYIVVKSFHGEEPQWAELGVFVVGLAGLLTGAGWNKTKQKEIEVNEENENK